MLGIRGEDHALPIARDDAGVNEKMTADSRDDRVENVFIDIALEQSRDVEKQGLVINEHNGLAPGISGLGQYNKLGSLPRGWRIVTRSNLESRVHLVEELDIGIRIGLDSRF